MTAQERQQRIKKLQEYLNLHGDQEYNFKDIYSKLLAEFHEEDNYNPDFKENPYLNNLRQTRDKQAAHYIETKRKRPKGNCHSEYREFISNFRHDVMEGLRLGVNPASNSSIKD